MASSSTPVPLATRKALRILEILIKVFIAAFLGQLLLSVFDTPGVVSLSGAKKAVVAGVIAVIQAILSLLGYVAPEGNPNTTSLLPSRLDPSTPPNDSPPVKAGSDPSVPPAVS